LVVKSDPTGARPKSKLMDASDYETEELAESKRRMSVKIETPVVRRRN